MSGQNHLVGQVLAGRYKLIKLIGAGGMGAVYQGEDHQMSNRVVAVKVLAPHLVSDEKQVLRFEQEARASTQLRHPNTISVLDFGQSDGHIFMVIEFLTGETLTNVLRKVQRLDPFRALYMMRQVCKSLAEAHSKGIIHRDLKPDNIFVCEIYGEKDFIKVIDFGIAKFLESGGQELTQAGKMFGTPRYLSPEQAQGLPLSAASDLYALGVILFEMLAGRPPFVAEDPIAVAIKHVQEQPPGFGEVAPELVLPDAVDGLVFKLLAKKPAQRHQSAEAVLEAIDHAMQSLNGGARMATGQFRPAAALTPARPKTIPPMSKSEGMLGKGEGMPDATLAIATVVEPSAEPAPTMAMDAVAALGPAAAEAHTMALDVAQAQEALRGRAGAARAAAAVEPAPKKSAPVVPMVAGVVVVAAVAGVLLLRGGDKPAGAPPSEATAAAESVKPAESAKPAEAAKPTEAARPAESAKPAEAAKPTEAARPAESAKPAEVAQPAAAAETVVKIVSTPPGADVQIEGLTVGKTPFSLKLSTGKEKPNLTLKLASYEDKVLEADKIAKAAELGVLEIPVELKAKPKPAAKPKAAKKADDFNF